MVPDLLIGVEFWRVSRKTLDVQPRMATDECLHLDSCVNLATIPKKNNRTLDLPKKAAQEDHDLVLCNVFAV
jgi:hypothetical protein